MVRKQLSLRHGRPQARGLDAELAMLSDEMRRAFFAAEAAYRALAIPYVLVGGLASGSHGEPRATKDIDFLVGEEAFHHAGPIVSFAVALPLQAYGVAIDPIPLPENPARARVLERGLRHPHLDRTTGVEVPILPALELAYMKLASPRSKDLGDVVGMLRAGSLDANDLQALVTGDDELERRFRAALEEHAREEAEE